MSRTTGNIAKYGQPGLFRSCECEFANFVFGSTIVFLDGVLNPYVDAVSMSTRSR